VEACNCRGTEGDKLCWLGCDPAQGTPVCANGGLQHCQSVYYVKTAGKTQCYQCVNGGQKQHRDGPSVDCTCPGGEECKSAGHMGKGAGCSGYFKLLGELLTGFEDPDSAPSWLRRAKNQYALGRCLKCMGIKNWWEMYIRPTDPELSQRWEGPHIGRFRFKLNTYAKAARNRAGARK